MVSLLPCGHLGSLGSEAQIKLISNFPLHWEGGSVNMGLSYQSSLLSHVSVLSSPCCVSGKGLPSWSPPCSDFSPQSTEAGAVVGSEVAVRERRGQTPALHTPGQGTPPPSSLQPKLSAKKITGVHTGIGPETSLLSGSLLAPAPRHPPGTHSWAPAPCVNLNMAHTEPAPQSIQVPQPARGLRVPQSSCSLGGSGAQQGLLSQE